MHKVKQKDEKGQSMREKKESQGSTQEVQHPTTKFRKRAEKVQGREMAET